MKNVYYMTSFRNLNICETMQKPFELLYGVNITNDSSVKDRFLTDEFRRAAGLIEATTLAGETNLVFGEFDISEMKGMPPEPFLLVILLWIDLLLRNAWLVKDHTMECDAIFLRVHTDSGTSWTRNFLSMRPSSADGTIGVRLDMSLSDMETWARTSDSVETYLHDTDSSSLQFMLAKTSPRSGRAVQYVDAARKTASLPFKIAQYCSAIETLFTTESTELSHKLSERVAFFLGEPGYDRWAVFSTIKNAYNIRSKLVHGDTLKTKQIEELSALGLQCDNYLRFILNCIFDSVELKKVFDSDPRAIEGYFSHLIFGSPTP
jgi:hypothetical protein